MNDERNVGKDENILYDLLINAEWPPETDPQLLVNKVQTTSVTAKAVTEAFRWFLPSGSSHLPPGLIRLVDKQIEWHLEMASDGGLLAVVQDCCVEIRSAIDHFGSTMVKCRVPEDPRPRWRRVAWSHNCTLLAYADSVGTVRVFNLTGSELFVIPPMTVGSSGDASCAAAGLVFLEHTASARWSAELLVINYRGGLKSYLVSAGTDQSFRENHSFSFSAHYSHGVTSAVYHPGHRLLLLGGCESGNGSESGASRCGITAWRVLSGAPYYEMIPSYGDDASATQNKTLRCFSFLSRQAVEQDGVFRFSLSPDARLLAVVHISGRLSLWEVPSLRQRAAWNQEQQPGCKDVNPEWNASLKKRKKIKERGQCYPLLDVSWWSDLALVLARCSGSLSVSSVRTLRNLLGESCEWLEPTPRLTGAHGGRFLGLECEVQQLAQKSSQSGEEVEEAESDTDDESSPEDRYLAYIQQGLYYVTEMDRFAPPPRKRARTLVKTYRLVSLRATTPMELYQRKIDQEEYGEALAVAQAYHLDTDLLYQRRWRESSAGVAAMQDYLSKIRKRSTVLRECRERVPENVDAAKELLEYGLRGTDLEALVAIGNGEDVGPFAMPEDVDNLLPYRDFLSAKEELERKEREMERKERENSKRRVLLAQVDFSRLTLEQKELCLTRQKLLQYLDRLATYEEILGGPHAAEERFDAEFFRQFRSQNIVLSARNYARDNNVQALDVLFTYHGADVLPHRLAILCYLPETTPPNEYAALLPEACLDDSDDREKLFVPWVEERHREMDWCEVEECRAALDQTPRGDDDHYDHYSFLYEEAPELLQFRTLTPSIQLLTDWYLSRALAIESSSGQVDCALALASLGKKRNIPGLELLYDDLVTMETLVYETPCETSTTLRDLQQLSDIDKLRLLMNNSSQEHYVKDVVQRMIPFLHRCESRADGKSKVLLREYLVDLARRDLSLPLTIFQLSKPDCQQKIIGHSDQLMALALECIYSSERDDQLGLCCDILECLPERGYGPETDVTPSLHNQVDKLEKHLSVLDLLEKHSLQRPVFYLQNSQHSREEAHRLMLTLCRHAGCKDPPVSEAGWRALLQDLLDMQKDVYTCLEAEMCLQVFVESLLRSGRAENVRLAGHFMHCSKVCPNVPVGQSYRGNEGQTQKVTYDRSVELVLAVAREYFNSSTSRSDPCMDLASAALQLITDRPLAVREELDLISALCQLEDFGVNMLPLQVRLRSNRLSVVEECISQSPTAYRQSAMLLNLAAHLRVAGDDEAECKGQVLTLLAEHALRRLDFKASYVHCRDLMAAGYSPGWEVSSLLGQSEGYADLGAREQLLAFSLAHCPPDHIFRLLAASSDLHSRVFYQAVNNQTDPNYVQRGRGRDETGFPKIGAPSLAYSVGAAGDFVATTIGVLATTGQTNATLTGVTDNCWLKDSLNCRRPIHGQGAGSGDQERARTGENADLERQGCSPFYQEQFDAAYVDPSQDLFVSFVSVPRENFSEALLNTGKLAEVKTVGQSPFSAATEVLLHLANDAFARDLTLALAYLLALPQALDANRCFEKQSQSAVSLQLALYYYSLLIYSHLVPCFKDKSRSLYQADPTLLIQLVTRHVLARSDWPEELEKLIGQLRVFRERLTELTQTQALRALCRGVDIRRFNSDAEYQKESILGLAETLDDGAYRTSLCLAQRYAMPLWDVCMTHLEFLFTNSGLSTRDIEKRSRSLGLFETLKVDPRAFHDHMTKYVFPGVEGTDLGRLLYCYTLLEAAGYEACVADRIPITSHVKLLRKLRAVTATGLDYRQLTNGTSDPLVALAPVLTSRNVLSLSKLADQLPMPGGGGATLSASAVHGAWLQRLFWEGDPQLLKRPPRSDRDFLHAYDICSRYLERMSPAHTIRFLDDITLSHAAADRLSVQARRELVRRAGVALHQLVDKWKMRGAEDHGKQEGTNPAVLTVEQEGTNPAVLSLEKEGTNPAVLALEQEGTNPAVLSIEQQQGTNPDVLSLEQAIAHLHRTQAHLDTLGHAFILSLRDSRQARLRGYAGAYDRSRSERSKVHELAVTMATDGQPLELIRELLAVAPPGGPYLSVRTVLQDAVQRVQLALRGRADALAHYPQPLGVMEAMASAVRAAGAVQSSDDVGMVTSDHLLAWLRPFCSDAELPVHRRCDVLQILEKLFGLGDADMMALLLLHRTQGVLGNDGGLHRAVGTEDVRDEDGRRALFRELLDDACEWEEFQRLALLLLVWPPMTTTLTTEEEPSNPWVELTSALLSHCPQWAEGGVDAGRRVLTIIRSLYGTRHRLSVACVRQAAALLLLDRPLDALKLMAESGDPQLLQMTLDRVNGITAEAAAAAVHDRELLSLLLDAGLLVGCVSSALYPPLVSLLLSGQEEERGRWDVEEEAAQLLAAGHGPEAGSLLLAHRGGRSQQAYGAFGSALAALRKWL